MRLLGLRHGFDFRHGLDFRHGFSFRHGFDFRHGLNFRRGFGNRGMGFQKQEQIKPKALCRLNLCDGIPAYLPPKELLPRRASPLEMLPQKVEGGASSLQTEEEAGLP